MMQRIGHAVALLVALPPALVSAGNGGGRLAIGQPRQFGGGAFALGLVVRQRGVLGGQVSVGGVQGVAPVQAGLGVGVLLGQRVQRVLAGLLLGL